MVAAIVVVNVSIVMSRQSGNILWRESNRWLMIGEAYESNNPLWLNVAVMTFEIQSSN